ncbi:hypothetical protein PENTCL1PPCAC_9934 [Pristionchus entomophagus]|uniref:FMN hydroxy acid dehydrogenase domain-containing protein n=1 Tax=Pristionchus entomophagus TaxID=358040 RepID=A0AAV5T5F6_9BILA|nr:hypothetical protein PENTCL1PPCAC_9934 [Pristionchus entomophagus]
MVVPLHSGLLTVSDYEKTATSLLPVHPRDYYNGGAEDEVTLRENKRAFQDYTIRPFCLRDASSCSLSTSFLSLPVSHPIGIAPTAFHRMAHPEGELATVRGAKASSALMIASSWSTTPLEEMKKEAGGHPMWFQLYVYKDRDLTRSIVRRAEAAGYFAIVLTVDTPLLGRRLADTRNRFQLPSHLKFANFASVAQEKMPSASNESSAFMNYVSGQIDPSLTWKDVRELAKSTRLPVIVKGVMRGEDAVEAINNGVKGIIVSNHGGRQIDSGPATIHILREIVDAVQGRVPVWMDGGVRNGRDIFKALALGATGVFVGRPILWGLTVAGENGVAHVLEILSKELEYTMRLAGCPTIESIREAKDIVVHKSFFARL